MVSPDFQVRQGATSFYHFDALGSARELTDANEDITDTYIYRAFGMSQATTGSTTNFFRWVGRLGYYQEPTLAGYYLRRRYHSPGIRRFVSRDPVIQEDVSAYAYVRNAATLDVDPSGRQNIALCIIYAAACGVLIAQGTVTCVACLLVEPSKLTCIACAAEALAAIVACDRADKTCNPRCPNPHSHQKPPPPPKCPKGHIATPIMDGDTIVNWECKKVAE